MKSQFVFVLELRSKGFSSDQMKAALQDMKVCSTGHVLIT